MIPILYAASETDFTTNGIGLLTDAVSCFVTEERNGAYEATLVYPAKGHLAEYIAEDTIIKAKANDTDEPQLFRIYKSGKQIGGNTTWNAEHISYELTGNPVERFSVSEVNAEQALNRLLAAAVFEHRYTATSDITTVNSTSIADVVSVRKALGGVEGSILDTWGGEYHFNNYRIELLKARGADNGVTIEYGKNLTDAKQERNISNIVTAIFPYAKYTPEGAEDEVYVSLREKTLVHAGAVDYAYKRCEIVDFSSEWESGTIITEDMLRAKAEAYLEKISTEPDINITLSYAQLKKTKDYKNIQAMESVALCDTVTVRIDKLQIEATAKIVKAKYDSLKERYDTMEIGRMRTNLTRQLTATQQEMTESIKRSQTSCVTQNNVGSYITQYYDNVIAAFNNNSKYVQLSTDEINIYNGKVDTEHLRARFDEIGNRFWRDNYYVGCIGTNQWKDNDAHKGLVFDLEYQGKYMAWVRQEESASGSYTTVLCYSRKNSIYSNEGIHLGADLYAHGFKIDTADHTNSRANGYTVADNKRVSIVTEIHNNGDGSIGWTTSSITVRDGSITGVPDSSTNI